MEELGEDSSGAAESITKLQTQLLNLTSGHLNIMASPDTFKSTYQIIDELSQIWHTLSDINKADITKLVAGLRQAQGFNALVSNFADARESMELFSSATGDAAARFETQMDTIQVKSAQLSATFQKIATDVVSSGFVKALIDIGNFILKFIGMADGALVKLAAIPATLIAVPAIARTLKDIDLFKNIGKSISGLAKPKSRVSIRFLGNVGAPRHFSKYAC